MASLVIKRPQHFTEDYNEYRILIDGHPVATIGRGENVRIEVGPGHHEVTASGGWAGSPSIGIEGDPEVTHHLIVAQNSKFYPTCIIATLLVGLPMMVLLLALPPLPPMRPDQWLEDALMYGRRDTSPALMLPFQLLCLLALLAPFVLLRKSALALVRAPSHDMTDQEITGFLKAQPLRPRLTVRRTMIIVAILAILFAAGIQLTRYQRQSYFGIRAEVHSELEDLVRADQLRRAEAAALLEKSGYIATAERQAEAKSAANADYHAAMRRKYEQALARGWFTVDTDPPRPVWP